jgi:DNA-binding CsgD family transcriptional regulator
MPVTALQAAQEALDRAAWEEARDGFQHLLADGEGDGDARAWEGLSWAAWWIGDEQLTFKARERAYRGYRAAEEPCSAARMAIWTASDHMDFRGERAPAAGWLERARKLLEDHPPCAEHGWLLILGVDIGPDDRASTPAERTEAGRQAARLGHEVGVADLEAIGLAYEGSGLIAGGFAKEGIRRLDEAAAVAAGEDFQLSLSPGWALCAVISACDGVGDFARAAQWCGRMDSYVQSWGGRHYAGVCRSAYGKVLATGGDWTSAETELLHAVDDLLTTRPGLASLGLVRLGELRARQGEVDQARALFAQAQGHPAAAIGTARIELEAGDATTARDIADRVLRRLPPGNVMDRAPALEVLVQAHVALGDVEAAAAAYYELRDTADLAGTPYLVGRADLAGTGLSLACGELEEARQVAEDAVDRFREGAAPYEGAHARVALGQALAELGRESAAETELRAAYETFQSLGAVRDAERTKRLRGKPSGDSHGTITLSDLTNRELEILRLVAQGQSDAEIADRLVLSPHTVHRHVANVRTKLGLPSRAAAVAYAAREGLL